MRTLHRDLIRLATRWLLGLSVFVGFVIVGTTAPPAGAAKLTKSTLVVGVVATETNGVVAGTVKDVPIAASTWQKWTNSHGGISGHPVKVIVKDDADDPARSLTAVETLVQQDHALAIVDDTGVDTSWASYISGAGIPVLCGSETGNGFECSNSPDFFPLGNTVIAGVWGQLKAASTAGAKSIAILYPSNIAAAAQAVALQRTFAGQVGMKFAGAFGIDSASSDFTAQCVAAQQAGADSVFPESNGLQIATSCSRQNYKPLWILAQGAWGATYRKAPNFANAVGPIGNQPFFLDSGPGGKTFRQAFSKSWPNFDSFSSPYAVSETWDALQLFATALANAPKSPTPQDVSSGIYALPAGFTLGGLIPPETLTPGKTHTNPCFYVIQLKNHKYSAPNGLKTYCEPGVQAS